MANGLTSGITINDDHTLRRISVLRPRTKEQYYALIAVHLLPNRKYIMRQEDLDKIRKTPASACVFDITPKSIPLSIDLAYPASTGVATWIL